MVISSYCVHSVDIFISPFNNLSEILNYAIDANVCNTLVFDTHLHVFVLMLFSDFNTTAVVNLG